MKDRKGMLEPAGKWPDGAPRLRYRLRLGDGTKSERFDVPKGLDGKAAAAHARVMQAKEDIHGGLLAAKKERARLAAAALRKPHELETADAWHSRFLETCTHGNVEKSRGLWRRWIAPHLVGVPMATLAREDVERVRDGLDDKIRAFRMMGRGKGRLMPKSALNAWSVLTTACTHAKSSKDKTLRVRDDDPTDGVLPPERGDSRRKTFLYPSEAEKLLACELVPIEFREMYAVAIYLYLRPNELWELRRGDVDLDETGAVHVTRAWDWEEETAKPPKTAAGIRLVPIADELKPLLRSLLGGRGPDELVFPWLRDLNEHKIARVFRDHLVRAGCDRPALRIDTSTHMAVNFRSCRDTGITWLALASVPLAAMQRRAGHEKVETTLGYVKQAEDLTGRLGRPFPALPLAQTLAQNPVSTLNRCAGGGSRKDLPSPASEDDREICEVLERAGSPVPARNHADAGGVGPDIGPDNPAFLDAVAAGLREGLRLLPWELADLALATGGGS